MIAVEEMVISITKSGYVKRLPVSTYRTQNRGGIGVMGMDLKDGDYIEHLFITSTHHFILFFTSRGKVYRLKVHELPLGSRQSKGRAIVNLLPLAQDEEIKAVIATKDFTDARYLVFATRNGLVKKTEFLAYNTPLKADGIIAISLRRRRRAGGGAPHQRRRRPHPGVVARARPSASTRATCGRWAAAPGASPACACPAAITSSAWPRPATTPTCSASPPGATASARPSRATPRTQRGGQGVITIKDAPDRGDLVAVAVVRDNHELILVSQDGTVIRIPVAGVRTTGPQHHGRAGDEPARRRPVASMARVVRGATTSPDEDAEAANGDLAAPVAGEGGDDFDDAADFDEGDDFEDVDLAEDFDVEDALDEE